MKWSWFKVPVKVEKINEYLFSDIVQSQKNKKVKKKKKIYRLREDRAGQSVPCGHVV